MQVHEQAWNRCVVVACESSDLPSWDRELDIRKATRRAGHAWQG